MQALPPGITVTIAENILFVGKAVRVLQRPTGPLKSHDLLPQSDAISFAQALRQLQQQDVFDQIGFERTVELIRITVSSEFMQEQQAQYYAIRRLKVVTSVAVQHKHACMHQCRDMHDVARQSYHVCS